MSDQDDEILDMPERDDDQKSRWNFLKYFSLALIVPGAIGMILEISAGAVLISTGLGLLFFRLLLVFITREKKFLFEYFYLSGIATLIIIFILRILHIYRNNWLLVVAIVLFAVGIFLVRTKEEDEAETFDQ